MEQAPQSQPDASAARIYLGSIPYTAKPDDIEEVLTANGFNDFEKIHISIDPISGLNPGYCFVDFPDRDAADHALASLSATMDGRPIKVGRCDSKKRNRGLSHEDDYAFRRWGDWGTKSSDGGIPTGRGDINGVKQGPHGALEHLEDMARRSEGRRLYVGGLGKVINQLEHNRDMMELFSDFNPMAIGKRKSPHHATRSRPGNHHYCFADFKTKEQANAAMEALNDKVIPGGKLRVSQADVRRGWRLQPICPRSGNATQPNRATASTDRRSKDA